MKDPEKVLDELYPVAVKQLWNQAEKLAGILKVDQLKMSNISRNVPFGYGFDLEYRGIQIALPNEFCGIDKDKIKVFLGLRVGFEIMNPSVK